MWPLGKTINLSVPNCFICKMGITLHRVAVSTHRVNTYKLPNQCLASSKSSEKWEIWIKDSFKQAITGVSKAQMITLFSWELQKLSVLKWSHLCQPWQNRPGKAMKSVFSHRYAWEQELSQKAAKNKNLHKGHHNLSETKKKDFCRDICSGTTCSTLDWHHLCYWLLLPRIIVSKQLM